MPIAAIAAANRAGTATGIPSWCTAHADTLRAIFACHAGSIDPILIEATCNQVNQHGGYTGMTPKDFRRFAEGLADEAGVPVERIILGGDHLGPNPWKGKPASQAMAEACAMVRDYVAAGFTKIHLDASMACADDVKLSDETRAARSAELCAAAESVRGSQRLSYVIGTEVPVPGGETEVLNALAVTTAGAAQHTHDLHRQAFAQRGLEAAFETVVGLVVQPGVDFGNAQIFRFDQQKAIALSQSVQVLPHLVFEAHSTDYQTQQALRALVSSHFAILKVGPELTFAYREAVFALAELEGWLEVKTPSRVIEVIESVMDAQPKNWRDYASTGSREEKLFGLSDRIRYYWPDARITAAIKQLRATIDAQSISPGLLSQFGLPLDWARTGSVSEAFIQHRVGQVVAKYRAACGLA